MKKIIPLLFSGFLLLTGCTQDEVFTGVLIRIENASDFDFKNIVVNIGTGQDVYGDLNANQISEYKTFESAFRYAFVELQIDGETFTHQPFDYVGETPLNFGKYTYKLTAEDSGSQYNRLSLTLIEN
ncbi:MAG: hypothetical protein SH848_21905 [Saprospiraceae bacterium]|nr:hypothetical protein [Saprospiraceae bacterium]MDZ4706599.1 hypothetical protein [Saprospiraceae bacterium]